MSTRVSTRRFRTGSSLTPALALIAAAGGLSGATAPASAQASLSILQVFEIQWLDLERRVPDVFLSRYNATWLPPPSIASFQSVGFDVFDRFNLGKPPLLDLTSDRERTTYGTENTFRALVEEMNKANVQVYPDAVLNHNSGRTTSFAFYEAGGYPGFHVPLPNPPRDLLATDDWGDFHGGNSNGFLQSENPGAANYDTRLGDLVALIDINQFDQQEFIRHPVGPDPMNIPAGTFRNQPDPDNARFYPDRDLSPDIFTNPASNHSGSDVITRYPFNNDDPMAGDPVVENPGDLLTRWTQWMLQSVGVDGFRLDASKHAFPGYWDASFDNAMFLGRTRADGARVNAFSFGENTTGNGDILFNFFRKDGFANRDSLDLSGAGDLRNLIGAGGFGNWNNVLGSHLDAADDGLQNGSAGIFHVFSHDNGTLDGPAALPSERSQGWFAHAYMLLRTGPAIVYHNAKGVPRSGGFFPDEGTPVALGWNPNTAASEDALTRLLEIRATHAFGQWIPLSVGLDVIAFDMSIPFNGGRRANLIVAANDRYDAGIDTVTVAANFPDGTRLHELTGNAANPDVDPSNQVPDVITVQNGQVTLQVPRNISSTGEHNRGYVAYGPVTPLTSLSIPEATTEIPPDDASVPDHLQRLNAIPIVTGDSFTIRLETSVADPIDNVTDDNALFRINAGAEDWNGSGAPDFSLSQSVIGGYEQFTDTNDPGMSNGPGDGLYEQVIDATRLSEGYHYISTIAFRQRPAGTTPLFSEDRVVVCVDREPAPVLVESLSDDANDPRPTFRYTTPDGTVEVLYTFLNLEPGDDPVSMISNFNAARRFDRNEFDRIFDFDLQPGENTITVVGIETSGRTFVSDVPFFLGSPPCNAADLAAPQGVLDLADVDTFILAFLAGDAAADVAAPFGVVDLSDIDTFITAFTDGCP
ncbi:MAG: GC-type dockerin domain-anchored protein [Planctomycetota bacterium]